MDKWLALDITTSGITKKKNRAVLFPVLKEHLVEWVDRANEQHVVISEATGKGGGSAFFFYLLAHQV